MKLYPLSLPQQAMFLDALKYGDTAKFNMGAISIVSGPFDTLLFQKSLEFAHRVHDVRRMRVHIDGEGAWQEFLAPENSRYPFEEFDFSSHPDPIQSAIGWVLGDFSRPIPLEEGTLHGDILFQLGVELYCWYQKFHHIANDGHGLTIFNETVVAAYNELHQNNRLPEFEQHPYIDFVEEDTLYAASSQFTKDDIFWSEKFQTLPQPLPFSARKNGLKGDILHTERCTLSVKREVYNSLVSRCNLMGVTPAQFLLACFFAYLHRFTGNEDIVIGTPILNRSNHVFRRTVGLFMGMMPLRIRIDKNETLFDLAAKIKAETRICYRHQRFPYGEILRRCRSVDGFSHGIFDVTFVYRKLDFDLLFGGSPMRTISLDLGVRDETLSIDVDDYNEAEAVNILF